ncbi:hypothetical protein BDW68DRAFT_167380 [Aspergillus falconensis]
METLETRLSEVKLPERFEDDYFHISEKLGLGNEAQNLTLSLNSTEEKLKVQQFNSAQTHDELREMTAKSREGESRIAKLESRIVILQEQISEIGSKKLE